MADRLELLKQILLQKKQIILQGAPGTGKTYNTAAFGFVHTWHTVQSE